MTKETPASGKAGASGLRSDIAFSPTNDDAQVPIPPGLTGEIAKFIYNSAPRPNATIAVAGAIGLMAGICGRSYQGFTNFSLNQYILVSAKTGMGKEAMDGGITALLSAATPQISGDAIGPIDFKGPSIVSAPGLIKWLDRCPSIVCIAGEFATRLKAMTGKRYNPNEQQLGAFLLDGYGKSGSTGMIAPTAYSDRDKRTRAIIRPALSILAESNPDAIAEAIDAQTVSSGLLPRFLVFEATGQRPVMNENRLIVPPPELVEEIAALCAHSHAMNHSNTPITVPADEGAKIVFRDFDHWSTEIINADRSEVTRELWNRAHLKAMKLATLIAVGINRFDPVVTASQAKEACDLVAGQTSCIIAKFEAGETGEIAGNEIRQEQEIQRVITEYLTSDTNHIQKYGKGTSLTKSHEHGIIPLSFIQQRLSNTKAFREDKRGSKDAISRIMKSLLEGDKLREVPKAQMGKMFGNCPRSFVWSDYDLSPQIKGMFF